MVDDREKDGSREEAAAEFKITDRRHFTADGDRRREFGEDEDAATTQSESGGAEPAKDRPTPKEGFERRPLDEPEGVDFTMLVNAMAQPALLFLGEMPHPTTGQTTVDLEQARIQIDMLDLLRVKCRGNLAPQEEGLLDQVLYQLRMVYVARSGKAG